MAMPPIMEKLLNLQKKVDVLEAYRYMRIGSIVDVTAPDLPLENCMWADGSLALFDLWPELKAKYEKGGFSGLLLPYNCSDEDKAAYPGKWVPDGPNPTGLFVPRLVGLFARYCGQQGAGAYQADAVQLGLNAIGSRAIATTNVTVAVGLGNITETTDSGESSAVAGQGSGKAHHFTSNQRTASETRPVNVALPVALYLGRSAQV